MCGNMATAVSIASPSISWRVFASYRICVLVSLEVSLLPSGEMDPLGDSRESFRDRAVALASMMAV